MCDNDEKDCSDNDNKWLSIVIIVGILTYGVYKTTELYFDRIEILQKQSQVVIEK